MKTRKVFWGSVFVLLILLALGGCGGGDGSEGIVGTGATEKKNTGTSGFQYDGSIRIVTP